MPVYKREDDAERDISWLPEDPLAKEFWEFLERIRKSCGENALVIQLQYNERQDWLVTFEKEIDFYKGVIKELDKNATPATRVKNWQTKEKMKKKIVKLQKKQELRQSKLSRRLYLDLYFYIDHIGAPPLSAMKKERRAQQYRHGNWHPHRCRWERASFLVSERGYHLLGAQTFFGWKDSATPATYLHLGSKDIERANLDARYDIIRREKARSNAGESTTTTSPLPESRSEEAQNTLVSDATPKYLRG